MTLEERIARLEAEVFKFPKPEYYGCPYCEAFQSTDPQFVSEHQKTCTGTKYPRT